MHWIFLTGRHLELGSLPGIWSPDCRSLEKHVGWLINHNNKQSSQTPFQHGYFLIDSPHTNGFSRPSAELTGLLKETAFGLPLPLLDLFHLCCCCQMKRNPQGRYSALWSSYSWTPTRPIRTEEASWMRGDLPVSFITSINEYDMNKLEPSWTCC